MVVKWQKKKKKLVQNARLESQLFQWREPWPRTSASHHVPVAFCVTVQACASKSIVPNKVAVGAVWLQRRKKVFSQRHWLAHLIWLCHLANRSIEWGQSCSLATCFWKVCHALSSGVNQFTINMFYWRQTQLNRCNLSFFYSRTYWKVFFQKFKIYIEFFKKKKKLTILNPYFALRGFMLHLAELMKAKPMLISSAIKPGTSRNKTCGGGAWLAREQ